MRKVLPLFVLALGATSHAGTLLTISNTVQTIGPGGRILVYGTVDNTTGTTSAAGLLVYGSVVSGLQTSSEPIIDNFYPGTYNQRYGLGNGLLPKGQSYTGLLLAFEPYFPTPGETGTLSLRANLYTSRSEGGIIFQQNDIARVNVVPEPASLSALGLTAVLVCRRRRASLR